MTEEQQAFHELESLCDKKGAIHAFSYLCRRDCTVGFYDLLKPDNLMDLYNPERLIRTELSVVHGLIQKKGCDFTVLTDDEIEEVSGQIESLLGRIHESLKHQNMQRFSKENLQLSMVEFFSAPDIVREFVFYSAEQAFEFQFSELAKQRYENDSEWLKLHVGFDMSDAFTLYKSICKQMNLNVQRHADAGEQRAQFISYVDDCCICVDTLCEDTGIEKHITTAFLDAFSSTSNETNTQFTAIDSINVVNFKPISKVDDKYYLFQITALAQSMYESPIFWMRDDKKYLNLAVEHRGQFTEEYAYNRLIEVFGEGNVFKNIDIFKTASEKIGEIDILVKYGTKFLVIQAKSKGMTLGARNGNAKILKDDFAKAVQSAYNQTVECADALQLDGITLRDSDGTVFELNCKPSIVYPVCLTSESYPSLSFQCRQHLEYVETDKIAPPFILDVFFLDILTEFLKNPLFLMSYVDRRVGYLDSMMASTEIVLLSLHLKNNLWLDKKEADFAHYGDDIASELDACFMSRRLALGGRITPDGVLKRYSKGFISKLLFKINRLENDSLTDLAFSLMKLNEASLDMLDDSVSAISAKARLDNKCHDFSMLLEDGAGITIHTSTGDHQEEQERLSRYIKARKYKQKQDTWIGVVIDPVWGMVRCIVLLDDEWCYDEEMDQATLEMQLGSKPNPLQIAKALKQPKTGRNKPCPCGSGNKYKRCCGS
ncbi:SEC-C metal-binding domain-containing protein [Vibrio splendidus]